MGETVNEKKIYAFVKYAAQHSGRHKGRIIITIVAYDLHGHRGYRKQYIWEGFDRIESMMLSVKAFLSLCDKVFITNDTEVNIILESEDIIKRLEEPQGTKEEGIMEDVHKVVQRLENVHSNSIIFGWSTYGSICCHFRRKLDTIDT